MLNRNFILMDLDDLMLYLAIPNQNKIKNKNFWGGVVMELLIAKI